MADFHHFPVSTLANPYFSLDYLTTAGPRLVRLVPTGENFNLFAEVPDVFWPSPNGDCYPLGGHRLWVGPEVPAITYIPDVDGVEVEPTGNGVILSREDRSPDVHYTRRIEIQLATDAPQMSLLHSIQNLGEKSMTVIPWAITQFRLGGRVVIPQAQVTAATDPLLPNRNLVLWSYTRLDDPRLHLEHSRYVVEGKAGEPALKIGAHDPLGWSAIEFAEGYTLVKRFSVESPESYGDYNSNVQCYVHDAFIELETLGARRELLPGTEARLREDWELYRGTLAELKLF